MKIKQAVTVVATVLALVLSGATADAGPEKKDKTEQGADKAKKNIPDDNGKGPERNEGDGQPPNGDHDHGCGNSGMVDDNEGWCGNKPKSDKPTKPETPDPDKPVKPDKPAREKGDPTPTTVPTTTTVPPAPTTIPPEVPDEPDGPEVPDVPDEAPERNQEAPDSPVIVRIAPTPPATLPTSAEQPESEPDVDVPRRTQSLPRTGGDLALLPFGLLALGSGWIARKVGRRG